MLEQFKNLQKGSGLFHRLMRGGAWLAMGSVGENAFRFVRNMILARLLAPGAFGVMAIVISVCSLFQVLTGLGIKESIVQNPRGTERSFLNAAFWLGLVRGILLYLTALALSPWLAKFYNAPELGSLMSVAFLSMIGGSVMSVGAFVAIKKMEYRKWVIIQQGGSIIGISTTLILAVWLKGVWALVIGYAVEGLARSILSYVVCPYRPRFNFEKEDAKTLLNFSKGMFGLPLLMLIYNEGATFTVGKMCTKEQLGVFAMALTLARIPSMFSNQLVDLLMPAFSEVQKEPRRVNQGILKVTTLALLVGLPAVSLVAIYGEQILSVVYGKRYAGGGNALGFLFMNELMLVCSVPIATVYMAIGKPWLLRRFSMLRAILIVCLIYPLIKQWGIMGAAMTPLLGMAGAYAVQMGQMRRVTDLDLRAYSRSWMRGIVAALPFAALCLMMSVLLGGLKPVISLLGTGAVAGLFLGGGALVGYRLTTVRNYFWPFGRKNVTRPAS